MNNSFTINFFQNKGLPVPEMDEWDTGSTLTRGKWESERGGKGERNEKNEKKGKRESKREVKKRGRGEREKIFQSKKKDKNIENFKNLK